jgi:hypothetical protein
MKREDLLQCQEPNKRRVVARMLSCLLTLESEEGVGGGPSLSPSSDSHFLTQYVFDWGETEGTERLPFSVVSDTAEAEACVVAGNDDCTMRDRFHAERT